MGHGVVWIGSGLWPILHIRSFEAVPGPKLDCRLVQAVAIALVATSTSFAEFATCNVLLGLGTAMVYPTLLAATGDIAHPSWRGSAVGVYRFWRDLGYAIGAVVAGLVADAMGLVAAVWLVALLTFGSGIVVLARMTERRRA